LADNPIQGDEFVDINSVRAEFNKVVDIFKDAKKDAIELAKEIKEALNVKGNTEATTKAINEQSKAVDNLTKEYDAY